MVQYLVILGVLLSLILGVIGTNNTSLTTELLALKYGYPIETHNITTKDGYILTMHRIPYSPHVPSSLKPKKVVFIQHGLLCSSSDFMLLGPGRALALILADAGFDVWLGNARGNKYSRKHISLDPSSSKFWDFDWHEIGVIDLPAMIEYVLEKTGVQKIVYIGHSQGTTAFFVLNSLLPQFNKYFESAHLLSPVAYMSHLTTPFITYAAPLFGHPTIGVPMDLLGNYEFQPSKTLMDIIAKLTCSKSRPNAILCTNPLFLAAQFDEDTIDPAIIDDLMNSNPAGASTKQFLHYMQLYNSGYFRQFDYGMLRNMIRYKQTSPPVYPIANIAVPLYMYYSDNDATVAVVDVEQLISELRCFVKPYRIPEKKFDHLGQMYNAKVRFHVYDRLLNDILTHGEIGSVL